MKEKKRCRRSWLKDPLCMEYHDKEWGRPCHEEKKLYELFLLEFFQAGLSWRTILHKRENFRKAYSSFNVKKIASYKDKDIERLMQDDGMIRSRPKIKASIQNARVFLAIEKEWGSFDRYIWHFTDGKTIWIDPSAASNALSDEISEDLKKRGAAYCGSITVYSYLQAIGIINSHEKDCFVFRELMK